MEVQCMRTGRAQIKADQLLCPVQHLGCSHVDACLCALHTPGENYFNPASDFSSEAVKMPTAQNN